MLCRSPAGSRRVPGRLSEEIEIVVLDVDAPNGSGIVNNYLSIYFSDNLLFVLFKYQQSQTAKSKSI